MKRYFLRIFFFGFILFMCLVTCKRPEYTSEDIVITSSNIDSVLTIAQRDSLNADLHDKIINYYLLADSREELDNYCRKIYDIGTRNNNPELILLSSAYIAQIHILEEDYEVSRQYITIARDNLKNVAEPKRGIIYIINNVCAGIAYRTDLNFPLSIEYLSRSAEMCREDKDSMNLCVLLSNISSIYYAMNDSTGITYAREAYDIAQKLSWDHVKIVVAILCSQYDVLMGNNSDALKYASEAVALVDSLDHDINKSEAYSVMASSCLELGRYEDAREYYDKASRYIDCALDKSISMTVYSGYANLYEKLGRPKKSLEMYRKALAMSNNSGNVQTRYQILYGLYNTHNMIGNTDSAFFYFKQYHDAMFYAFNYMKERKVNSILRENQRLQHEKIVREKDVEIVKKSRANFVKLFIVIILLIISVALVIVIRNNKRNYRNTIMRYEQYKRKIEEIKLAEKNKMEQVSSNRLAMFESIETLLKDKQIFRDKSLSLDMIASVMKTSVSNVSSAVNMYSGMTFPNYVNSYRIDYALKQISDKNNKDSLAKIFDDAGFMSKTTAYRSFQKEIGCSPSAYRKLVSGH